MKKYMSFFTLCCTFILIACSIHKITSIKTLATLSTLFFEQFHVLFLFDCYFMNN